MSRRITYKAYKSADTWQELGLIGDTLMFTDDEIVTQQAIGYTKHNNKFNCPMDIAVMYSMLNRGQGATPTAKELLNDYTRTAYFYEAGIVADSFWYDEPKEEMYQCKSTVTMTKLNYNTGWYGNLQYAPRIDVNKLEALITAIVENNDGGVLSNLLDAYNWEMSSRHTALYSYYPEYLAETNAGFKGLMNNRKDNQVSAVKVIELIQPYVPFEIKSGSDWCTRAADGESFCARHKPVNHWKRGWVYYPELGNRRMYKNEPISRYNRNDPQLGLHSAKSRRRNDNHARLFEQDKRQMIDSVDDKLVLRLMNKSLTRMVKSGRVSQVSSGRGRMFEWKHWEWLELIRHRILASNAKARKIGDVVNGWVYTKGNITESFGMEICDHEWVAEEQVTTYRVRVKHQVSSRHHAWSRGGYYEGTQTNEYIVPIIFWTIGEANGYAARVRQQYVPLDTGLPLYREVTEDFDVLTSTPTVEVIERKIELRKFSVEGTATIEDYDTPMQMYRAMQQGNDDAYAAIADRLLKAPSQCTTLKQVRVKEEVEATA